MATEAEVWLLTEQGILTPDGSPLPSVPFQGRVCRRRGNAREDRIAVVVDENEVWTRQGGRVAARGPHEAWEQIGTGFPRI